MFACLCLSINAFADTVILRDGQRMKGLIVDEFRDRVILSTPDGERTVMKSDIRSAVYDSEQKALLQQGRNQLKKGQYIKAYQTFEKAVELDPEQPEAIERLNYLRSYLETKTRYDVAAGVRKRREDSEGEKGKTLVQEVKESLGLVLEPGEKYVSVKEFNPAGVPARKTDLRPGDRIVAVWSEMTAYMGVDEVAEALLAPGEVRITVERTVFPELDRSGGFFGGLPWGYRKIIGAGLGLRTEGVIVTGVTAGGPFDRAGIRKGDLIFRIEGNNTRYMPMRRITELIRQDEGRRIEIVIRRDLTLWRKE